MSESEFKPKCPEIIHNGEVLKATWFEAAHQPLDIHEYLVGCGLREPVVSKQREVVGRKIAKRLKAASHAIVNKFAQDSKPNP